MVVRRVERDILEEIYLQADAVEQYLLNETDCPFIMVQRMRAIQKMLTPYVRKDLSEMSAKHPELI